MTDRGWYDDSECEDAVQRAARATRFGWIAIAGVTGLIGLALVAAVVVAVFVMCLALMSIAH
ncbi:hypothetical protein GCM10010430_14990 [Kitasatospora cystarginea]|uniref:Uncharacterized protein n=1 Tax=Kitasatospora cystarginea TaxID=58350 RepID=A0ABP5QGR1_9ACTN